MLKNPISKGGLYKAKLILFFVVVMLFVFYAGLIMVVADKVASNASVFQWLINSHVSNFEELVALCSSQPIIRTSIFGGLLVIAGVFYIRAMVGMVIRNTRTYHQLKAYKKKEGEGHIIIDSNRYEAFCGGIFQPCIYISNKVLESFSHEELESILAHEKIHQKSFDPLLIEVVKILTDSMQFIPGVKKLRSTFMIVTELYADQSSIDLAGREVVANSLYKMLVQEEYVSNGFARYTDQSVRIKVLIGQDYDLNLGSVGRYFAIILVITTVFLSSILQVNAVGYCEMREEGVIVVRSTSGDHSSEQMSRELLYTPL
ncbi:M56 family metallopeptidase [Candidatus Dojkabacteria bacterium]|uniref:M56 family metallopeptidase n=1 Tax=Candidatus Dojkabacteria bacterium TaxID=2099670 RepID=A0A955RKQ2_9BACT|nr:M56 family metallopeptidase [Candidatus Dojkabacteria bacterium]